jgi:endoglucanase
VVVIAALAFVSIEHFTSSKTYAISPNTSVNLPPNILEPNITSSVGTMPMPNTTSVSVGTPTSVVTAYDPPNTATADRQESTEWSSPVENPDSPGTVTSANAPSQESTSTTTQANEQITYNSSSGEEYPASSDSPVVLAVENDVSSEITTGDSQFAWGMNFASFAYGGNKMVPGYPDGNGYGNLGTYGWEYYNPDPNHLDYFISNGFDLYRYPIRWERIQPNLYGDLDTEKIRYIDDFLDEVAARNAKVIILLCQNIPDYIGGPGHEVTGYYNHTSDSILQMNSDYNLPIAAFADIWTRLATRYKDHPAIAGYDLISEPRYFVAPDQNPHFGEAAWFSYAQEAITAIRSVDAKTQIWVEGYSGNHSWNWPNTSDSLQYLQDPHDNLVFSAHCYLSDHPSGYPDGGGNYSKTNCNDCPMDRGISNIEPFVDWLRRNELKGNIGEFGVPWDDVGFGDQSACWSAKLELTLDYVASCSDVLESFIYWHGDPILTKSRLSLLPLDMNNPVDKPFMGVLREFALEQ